MNTADELVIIRDQGKCVRCGLHVVHLQRGVAWSIHHRRPRGMGGTSAEWVNLPANLIVLCGSGTTGCHGWVEANRNAARELGYLVPSGVAIAERVTILHALHGLVRLTDNGGWATPGGYEEWETA